MPTSKRLCPGINGRRCPANAVVTGKAKRCPACTPAHEQERGTRQARGYDRTHDRLRADWQRRMDAGETVPCWRCGKPVDPSEWHLGHDDHDRTRWRGPEHPRECNLRAAGRASHRA